MQILWLRSAHLQVAVAPALGAALVRLDAWRNGAWQPLLRPMAEDIAVAQADPSRDAACYPLVPWSNRIGGGGFAFDGRFHAVARNRDDEPWPIHGTGWQRAWRVSERAPDRLTLQLLDDESGPHRYAAWQSLRLHEGTLLIELGVRNVGAQPLPFGLGLHPFFVRDADTRLQAAATAQWQPSAPGGLPDHTAALADGADFRASQPLPAHCIDHAFEGWSGTARIDWPQRGLGVSLASDCRRFVLYTPVDSDFFCFEPVDHPIDALNLPAGPQALGMTVLAPGQALVRHLRLRLHVA